MSTITVIIGIIGCLGISAPVIYFVYEIGRIVNILKRIDDDVHEIKHKAVRIDRNINRIDDNVREINIKKG